MREWTSEMDSKNTGHISEQPDINCDTNMSHTEFDHLACSNKSNSQNLVPVARGDIQKRTYWFWHPSRWLVAIWQCLINQTVYHQLSAWNWLKSCMKMHCSWDGCERNTCQLRLCPANSAWDPPSLTWLRLPNQWLSIFEDIASAGFIVLHSALSDNAFANCKMLRVVSSKFCSPAKLLFVFFLWGKGGEQPLHILTWTLWLCWVPSWIAKPPEHQNGRSRNMVPAHSS